MGKTRYSAEEAKTLKGNSDVERLERMTDEDIDQAAKDDPDSAVLTDEELSGFQRSEHRGGGVYGHKKNHRQAG